MRRAALALPLALVIAGCGARGVIAPTAKEVVGPLPTTTGGAVGKGDAAAGKTLFNGQGCGGCHTYAPAGSKGNVGPNLDRLAADAKKANQGTLEEYAATSIKDPGAYVAPGFPNGVMPSYSQLSAKQLADLVAFLTQKQG